MADAILGRVPDKPDRLDTATRMAMDADFSGRTNPTASTARRARLEECRSDRFGDECDLIGAGMQNSHPRGVRPEFAHSGVMSGAPCESSEVDARSASVGFVHCAIGINITADGEAVYSEIGIVGADR